MTDSREDRVIGLLKQLEMNIIREESQANFLISDLQHRLNNIVPNVNKEESYQQVRRSNKSNTAFQQLKGDPRKDRPWTSSSQIIKKTQSKRTESRVSRPKGEKIRPGSKKGTGDAQVKDTQIPKRDNKNNDSNVSLKSSSSKVQQLRLFWDKFFLMETEQDKSNDQLIDKKIFLSEAKYEVFEKPRNKSMRKNAAKYLEKPLPPTRTSISFRMISPQRAFAASQQKNKKRKEEEYSVLEMPISREVSTYMGKMSSLRDDFSEASESESVYTLAESDQQNNDKCSKQNDAQETLKDNLKEASAEWKRKLYRIFLCDQLADNHLRDRPANVENSIYKVSEAGRNISCSHFKGFICLLRGSVVIAHCHVQGVVIMTEEAIFLHPPTTHQKIKRKPRRNTTLLPCYYFNVERNVDLVDLKSLGDCADHFQENKLETKARQGDTDTKLNYSLKPVVSYEKILLDPSKYKENNFSSEYIDLECKHYKDPELKLNEEECPLKAVLSYEKITLDSSVFTTSKNIKLVISTDQPETKVIQHFFLGLIFVLFLGVVAVAVKLTHYSLLY